MTTETPTKINKMISSANQIAVVLPEYLTIDVLCAGLALHHKISSFDEKSVSLFTSSKQIPAIDFIPLTNTTIYSNFGSSQELTVKVSGQRVKPKQLRYEKKQDDLFIYIAPEVAPDAAAIQTDNKPAQFTSADVEVFPPASGFDLLIILGAENLEALGSLYENNPEIFYNTSKIVINNKIEQEYFATLTWVEADIPSLSQLLTQWFVQTSQLEVDSRVLKNDFISTSLLAGIISGTQSFSDPRTTPDTLAMAAKLVSNGARRQDIIKYLYKTKPFNLLQLWGRALARVKTFQDDTILYTVLTSQDFTKSQTTPELLAQVVSEVINMANNYKLIILAAEVTNGVDLIFSGPPHIKIKQLAKNIDPTFAGQPESLVENYQYIRLNLPNFKLEDLEPMISTLSASGI